MDESQAGQELTLLVFNNILFKINPRKKNYKIISKNNPCFVGVMCISAVTKTLKCIPKKKNLDITFGPLL